MKVLLLFLILFGFLPAFPQFKTASMQVSGLTCALCSKAVQRSLEKVPFVESVTTNIKTQEYSLKFRENTVTDLDVLRRAVEDAGFSVARLQLTMDFEGVKVDHNTPVKISDQSFLFLNAGNEVLSGAKTLTVIEKDFLTTKEFKKYCSDLRCAHAIQTAASSARIYRVII
jgi:copper chaperone CopZ